MKELEKKSQLETWTMEVECTGSGNDRPCGRYWKVNSQDIVKRYARVMDECDIDVYGFICPECHCFTEIRYNLIPRVIINRCSQAESDRKSAKKNGWKRFFKSLFS